MPTKVLRPYSVCILLAVNTMKGKYPEKDLRKYAESARVPHYSTQRVLNQSTRLFVKRAKYVFVLYECKEKSLKNNCRK